MSPEKKYDIHQIVSGWTLAFEPKEDITAWELAQCLRMTIAFSASANRYTDHSAYMKTLWAEWPEEVRRHWQLEGVDWS